MYFLDALKVLVRRWYIVVAGLLVIAVSSVLAISWVPTTYQASGQVVLLLPPEATGSRTPTNPYLNLQDGLTLTASIVAGTLSSKDAAREMERSGYDSEFAIAISPGGGPLLVITAKDTDPAAAMATRDAVIDRVGTELERMQTKVAVPRRQWIHATPNAVGERAEVLPGSKIRALAAIVGAGLTVTLVLAFVVDGFRSRRRTGDTDRNPRGRLKASNETTERTAVHAPTVRSAGREPRAGKQSRAPEPHENDAWFAEKREARSGARR